MGKAQQPSYGGISQSVSGGQMYGGMQAVQGNNNQQTMTNHATSEENHSLAQTAQEIQQLLQRLERTYPTKTSSEKMMVVVKAVDEIENNPSFKARVVGVLKAGGSEALKELINHPLVNIMMASIEGWQEAG
ncbi:MAG: hypothetical protein HC773_28670 [Scytonema sp. CRU_2_7]|nr:hypothetical protein [Scytonema sp. CRU_2_7]